MDSRKPAFAAFDGRNRQKLSRGDQIDITSSSWPVSDGCGVEVEVEGVLK